MMIASGVLQERLVDNIIDTDDAVFWFRASGWLRPPANHMRVGDQKNRLLSLHDRCQSPVP
eukprot:5858828-Pyramimonas_sp.AAC.1